MLICGFVIVVLGVEFELVEHIASEHIFILVATKTQLLLVLFSSVKVLHGDIVGGTEWNNILLGLRSSQKTERTLFNRLFDYFRFPPEQLIDPFPVKSRITRHIKIIRGATANFEY